MNVVLSLCMARESVSAQPAWKTWGRHLACQCAGGTPAPLGEEVDVVRHQAVVEERERETLPGFLEQGEEKLKRGRLEEELAVVAPQGDVVDGVGVGESRRPRHGYLLGRGHRRLVVIIARTASDATLFHSSRSREAAESAGDAPEMT